MVPARTTRTALFLLAAVAVALVGAMVAPFAAPLLVAAVLAGALYPLNERLAAALGGRRGWAALGVTTVVVLAAVLPIGWLGFLALQQVGAGSEWVRQAVQSEGLAGLVARLPGPLDELAARTLRELPTDLQTLGSIAAEQGGRAAALLGGFIGATGVLALKTLLFLVAFFFLLVDGPALVRWLDESMPLQRGQVAELLGDFRRATVAVLLSSIATSTVQSVAALLGYLVAGVPHAVFFGFVTFLVALVPVLGATPMVVAIAVLQLATGRTLPGAFLLAWAIPVSLIDNFVKPALLRRGLAVHPVVIFFTLIGGVAAFGVLGILLGPLALAFLLAAIRMIRRDLGT